MIRRIRRLVLAFALATIVLPAVLSTAYAQKAMNETVLALLPINSNLEPGKGARIQVRLTTGSGVPIPGKPVSMTLGDQSRTAATDENGMAEYNLQITSVAGVYNLTANFKGDARYLPANLSQSVVVGGGEGNTRVHIEPLGAIPMGKRVAIRVQLTTDNGIPIPNERIQLYVDGQKGPTGLTDARGEAVIDADKDISAGTHTIAAIFEGTAGRAPSNDTLRLGVNTNNIEIHTVPALEGVQFSLEGRVYGSDNRGIVSIPVGKPGNYHIEILPYRPDSDKVQATFSGWGDNTPTSYNDIVVPTTGPIQVGFNLSYKVSQSFIDLGGNVVDPKRVTSMTFKRSDGKMFTFDDGAPRWLEANHVVRRVNGIVPSPFQYSLMSLIVNGTNVVSEQQQRFYVKENDHWVLQLLLFAAHVKSHDQLFGFPMGSSITLEYPDKLVQTIPLDEQSQTRILSLPRGQYKIGVKTNMGISPVSNLTMSRNQEVDLPVLSYFDIAFFILIGVILGPGILLIGQPGLRRAIRTGAILRPRRWLEAF